MFEYQLIVLQWIISGGAAVISPSCMQDLNILGQQGWEVVSVIDKVAFLKRAVKVTRKKK